MEMGHEIISLPTTDSSRAVVHYWRKAVHIVLVKGAFFPTVGKTLTPR